ncbi:MAG TPA: hypothetical protein VJ770_06455 [Stellaceae bacterium]|nr:hypothetical protein [Stellaceae bacterium]
MSSSEYYLEQAARCRRLAAHVLDQDLQKRLLELAEEYERKVAPPPRGDPDGRVKFERSFARTKALSVHQMARQLRRLAARAPAVARDLLQIAEDLEKTAEPAEGSD